LRRKSTPDLQHNGGRGNSTIREFEFPAVGLGLEAVGDLSTVFGILLTLTSGVDRLLNGVQNQRPHQISANPYGNKSLTNYLNPGAFTLPAVGSLGNMGPSSLVGHTTWQFDAALSRVFRLHEIQSLEARAEAYNVTNSLRPGNPNIGLNQGTFGQITTALDPRILQFALKYIF